MRTISSILGVLIIVLLTHQTAYSKEETLSQKGDILTKNKLNVEPGYHPTFYVEIAYRKECRGEVVRRWESFHRDGPFNGKAHAIRGAEYRDKRADKDERKKCAIINIVQVDKFGEVIRIWRFRR